MAQCSGSVDNAAGTIVDINAVHTRDWIRWTGGGIVTKSGGGSTIGATSGGFDLTGTMGRLIGWTNGTPTASGSDDNARFHGAADTFTIPADTSVKTAVFYLGTFDFGSGVTQFTITATLSDGSAGPYTFTTTGANLFWNVTLAFAAASAGQTLTVVVTPTGNWLAYSAVGYSAAVASSTDDALFFGVGT